MQRSSRFRMFLTCLALGSVVSAFAAERQSMVQGQLLSSVPAAAPVLQVTQETASDWMVWRIFYDALLSRSKDSSAEEDRVLTWEIGLSPNQARKLAGLGKQYLTRLQQSEDVESAEIQRRYKTGVPLALSLARSGPNGGPIAGPPQDLRDRVWVQDVPKLLAKDGLDKVFEERKQQLFSEHQLSVIEAIGSVGFNAIHRWIQGNLADRIKMYKVTEVAQ